MSYTLEASSLFSTKGLVAVVTGGGTGIRTYPAFCGLDVYVWGMVVIE